MARQSFKPSSRDRRHMVDVADDGQTPNGVSVDLDDKDPDKYEIIETDDTPEYDRGKPTDLDYSLADQEDDLRDVGEKTRKRIDRLKFETHTERRGREAAERERDAALEMIKQQNGDLQKLRQRDGAAAVALAESMTSSNKSSMESAQRKLAAAHDEGNGTDIAAATAEISRLGGTGTIDKGTHTTATAARRSRNGTYASRACQQSGTPRSGLDQVQHMVPATPAMRTKRLRP
jgi:hypothetical protein